MASNSTDETNKIENLIETLRCPVCFEVPYDPVVTECCNKIVCNSCMKQMKSMCPYCREVCNYSASLVIQRMLNNVDHECEYCKEKIKKGEIKSHNLKCEKYQQNCPSCKNKFDQASLMNHLSEEHREELMRNLNFIADNFKLKNFGKNEIKIDTTQNANFMMAKLGISGKYYCGTNLSGPRCVCCDGVCGGKFMNGCNCAACMELDLKARNLPKGHWLVNADGFNAKKSSKNGLFYCGRRVLTGNRSCGPDAGENCESCNKLNEMEKNTYMNLIQSQSNKIKKRAMSKKSSRTLLNFKLFLNNPIPKDTFFRILFKKFP
jgi:hypothetical protein